ncbi:MAG TPA: hypothetical protein VNI84_01375 [Pyrinomonadaceae bacterium]|nr:hypothetical protein [Pyrinomonadaceae bacterium]
MALALLGNVQKRIVRILNANPGAWSKDVSGKTGAFPDNDEILAAILEADEHVVTRGYFSSVNSTLAQPFMVVSGHIPIAARVPFHYGNTGKVELSKEIRIFSPESVSIVENSVTIPAHKLATGQVVSLLTTKTLPPPLVSDTDYFVINTGEDVIKFAATMADALAGNAIDITGQGVLISVNSLIVWQNGVEAVSLDDILNARAAVGYLPASAYDFLYKIYNGNLYHLAARARVEIPTFTRTAILQARQAEETLIISTAIRFLTKHASPVPFDNYIKESFQGLQQLISDGTYRESAGVNGE